MNDPAPGGPPRRIGLRAVAEAAHVSLMTASLALRNSPRLSPETRQRVREVAEQLGYRPDPEISRLMGRLRPSRKSRGSVVIAMVDLHAAKPAQIHPYEAGVRQGITTRADALGFGVSLFPLSEYHRGVKQLLRVIRHRGITGAILLPSSEPVAFANDISWDGLSVVAATSTVTAPHFHQVSPNHLQNITTVIETVQRRGRKRLGAIFSESLEFRTHHAYSIALAWHGHRDRILILPDALPESAAVERVAAWLKTHAPDAILGGDAMTRVFQSRRLAHVPTEVEIVTLTSRRDSGSAYLDQRPELVGACAVSLLTGMMHNNETGVPAEPQLTTIRGVLRAAAPRARATAASK
jgi:DNA-binding LacI/PurR family transcriptional regulator